MTNKVVDYERQRQNLFMFTLDITIFVPRFYCFYGRNDSCLIFRIGQPERIEQKQHSIK